MNASAQNEMGRLVRVNREQQALLDQIYQYVDEQGLAKLGQSRVKALIEAHKRAEKATLESLLAAAPDVQGELVAVLLIDEPERTERGLELGDWDIAPNATAIEAFARLAAPGAYQLYLAPQPAEQQPMTDAAKLAEALERIASMDSMSYHSLDSAKITARAALSAYRKQGGEA